jgi:hypothetical protein
MSQNHVAHASNQSQNERVSGDPSISIAPVQHRLHIGGQAEPFLPGRKLSVCCSALQPGRQVRHQLIHELKAAEVLFFAFVESLRGSSPGDSIGFCIVRDLSQHKLHHALYTAQDAGASSEPMLATSPRASRSDSPRIRVELSILNPECFQELSISTRS